jgi:RNA polymerase sigma-70 factor, ECF subfamily
MSIEPKASDTAERLARWVDQHGLAVRGYLRSLTGRRDVADDLAQEVFKRAWMARERYIDQGQERAYLLTIADRLACDVLRRKSRELGLEECSWQLLEPMAPEASPLETLVQREARATVEQALTGLTPVQRRVVLLRFYGDMTFQEISTAIECPLNTVLSHCRRALLALKQTLEEKVK